MPEVKIWSWSWDTAVKIKDQHAFSVATLWAECETGYYLVNIWRHKVQYPELRKQVKLLYDEQRSSEVLVEDKASGQQLIQDFQRIGNLPIIGVIPGKDMPISKEERLIFSSSLFEAGKVWLPENKPWVAEYIEEMISFPNAQFNDQVDSTTQYLCRKLGKREPRIYAI